MSEKRKKSSAGFWATVFVVAVLLLPFLYVAALGPMTYFCYRTTISVETYQIFERPYFYCAEHCGWPQWFWDLSADYCNWWQSKAMESP